MSQTGHIKDTKIIDKNDYRQFVINCIGANDQRNYFNLSPFGFDSIATENTRVLTLDSKNKDVKFCAGVLNKIKIDDLKVGESVLFSTSENGKDLKSYIRLNNDGTMHQNGDADNLVGFLELKDGFDKLKADFNNLITAFNTHKHPTAATGSPSITTITGSKSTASIDLSKKDNLKTE